MRRCILPLFAAMFILPLLCDAAPKQEIKGIVFCQVPNYPNGRCRLHMEQFRVVRRPDEARLCTLIPARPDGKLTDLTSKHFASAIQPDLSYDGKKVIFAAKKTKDRNEKYNIYEMNVDGTGLRQITKNMGDCIDPNYLPNGKIVFSSDKTGFRDEYDRDTTKVLYTCNPDGSGAERITFNLSSDTATIVLNDGRLLFTSWQHHGNHQGVAGIFALATCNPDGTVFMPFMGNHRGYTEGNNTKSYSEQLTDGRVVYVDTAGHRHYNSGGLSSVLMEKPLHSRKILTPGEIYNGHNMAGRYASPYPLPNGGMICSFSPGHATGPLREDPSEDPHLGIYYFDFKTGRPGKLIFDDPNAQDYDALAIYKRTPPPVIPSMVIPGKKTGTFLCTNAYLSDRPKQDKRVVVGELPPAKPGEIKYVRVMEGFGFKDTDPKKHRRIVIDILQMSFGSGSNGGNNFEQKNILGYAPVEPDGSFHIEVPADTVLSLQTLDKNYCAIETQLTWVWVRPGEKRLCIGCHENRETALPNLDCQAMRKPPHFVAPPKEKRRTVDFRRDIMPIIEKRCGIAGCHDAKTQAGGLDLRPGFDLVFHRKGCRGRKINAALFNQAYESLLQAGKYRVGKLVIPSAARHSPLIWRIYGKQLAFADRRCCYKGPMTQMPPNKPLTEAEKRLFVEWVDIGAQWDNIPAEDDLPGYDADQSRKMAKEAAAMVKKEITDPKKAFEVRCTECHDYEYLNRAKYKKKTEKEWLVSINRMDKKRKGWIHKDEMPIITKYILDHYFIQKKK
ncbi:MAG: hypothetical protein GXP25_07540 [Planctomycetes bacterium]|nr:hypothetical protein [Planctomycetota bacterium]